MYYKSAKADKIAGFCNIRDKIRGDNRKYSLICAEGSGI
jgi:hypothetical protein